MTASNAFQGCLNQPDLVWHQTRYLGRWLQMASNCVDAGMRAG